jgi:hypothetical protein
VNNDIIAEFAIEQLLRLLSFTTSNAKDVRYFSFNFTSLRLSRAKVSAQLQAIKTAI